MYYLKELCNFNNVLLFDGAEFELHDIPKNGNTAFILISQSGETKDLHRCLQIANENNIFTIGVINVVDSLIAREVNCGCYLNAGREVGVASTKAFTSQCLLLSLISIWFAQINNININKRKILIDDLRKLPNQIEELLENQKVKDFIHYFNNKHSTFILGKGKSEAVAHEGALKIKEISYIHAESYSSSSLKHGPFALLEDKFPVILINPNDRYYYKSNNAKQEILSRNANIIVIGENIKTPINKSYQEILDIIILQLFAYYLSINKGINPDMPKNLAKVVTVE
jgi:glucosamine--fructose-6-phosphate aminotransferase (isomerizing)